MSPEFARTLNALGLLGLSVVLGYAFVDQFLKHDLPCPLCLVQRMGFVAAGVGIAFNLCFGPRPAHYAIAILSAVVGGAASLRQIALHVVPGTGTYGDAFLGLHFYSWAFVVFGLIIAGSAMMMLFERQFDVAPGPRPRLTGLALVSFALFALLALGNGLSTFAECELGLCPDNPTEYQLLSPQTAPASD